MVSIYNRDTLINHALPMIIKVNSYKKTGKWYDERKIGVLSKPWDSDKFDDEVRKAIGLPDMYLVIEAADPKEWANRILIPVE